MKASSMKAAHLGSGNAFLKSGAAMHHGCIGNEVSRGSTPPDAASVVNDIPPSAAVEGHELLRG